MSVMRLPEPAVTWRDVDLALGRSSRTRQPERREFVTFFRRRLVLSESRIVRAMMLSLEQSSKSTAAGACQVELMWRPVRVESIAAYTPRTIVATKNAAF